MAEDYLIYMSVVICIISGIVLIVWAPMMSLMTCFSEKERTISNKTIWVTMMVLTWPVTPFVFAIRKKNYFVIALFTVSLFGFILSLTFLISQNVDLFLELVNDYRAKRG